MSAKARSAFEEDCSVFEEDRAARVAEENSEGQLGNKRRGSGSSGGECHIVRR